MKIVNSPLLVISFQAHLICFTICHLPDLGVNISFRTLTIHYVLYEVHSLFINCREPMIFAATQNIEL
jgi:hypothetical protein